MYILTYFCHDCIRQFCFVTYLCEIAFIRQTYVPKLELEKYDGMQP